MHHSRTEFLCLVQCHWLQRGREPPVSTTQFLHCSARHYVEGFMVLQMTEQDQSRGVIIVPVWTTQIWFPHPLRLFGDHPVLLPCYPQLLALPTNLQLRHPLHNKLKLMACKLSGIQCEQEEFRRKLQLLFSSPGWDRLKNNIRSIFRSGTIFAVKGVSIPAQFLP